MNSVEIVQPAALPRSARIGIIAPAGPMRSPEHLELARQYLNSRGHEVVFGAHINDRHMHYLAGSDAARMEDLHAMFADNDIDAIFCARGGYGVTRFLRALDFDLVRRYPKIFVGFSDISALQCAFFVECGLVTFSGVLAAVDFGRTESDIDPLTERSFWAALHGDDPSAVFGQPDAPEILIPGAVRGRLICGTLSLFASLCGTPWMPDLRGKILLLEDVGEQPYAVDRMLCQLFNNGALDELGGLAFGLFNGPKNRPAATPQPEMETTLHDWAERIGKPTVSGVRYGHVPSKLTLPFGAMAEIDTAGKGFRLLERGVAV